MYLDLSGQFQRRVSAVVRFEMFSFLWVSLSCLHSPWGAILTHRSREGDFSTPPLRHPVRVPVDVTIPSRWGRAGRSR